MKPRLGHEYAVLVRRRKTFLCLVPGHRKLVKKRMWVLCPEYRRERV